jgi:hypothetical protein
MTRGALAAIVAACAVVGALLAAPGCSSAGATCDCADPQITINVPADIASSITVASIQLSGPACTNLTPTCTNQTNGCTAYGFTPNGAGACAIVVDGNGTSFTDTVNVVSQTGCCAGYYPSPASAAQVDVPEPGGEG